MPRFLLLGVLLLGTLQAQAQICPGLTTDALRSCLRDGFSPSAVYSYNNARDTLFLRVYLEPGDSLRDVYTGKAIWLDTTQRPRTFAYNATPSFHTEHAWPQSLGAGSNPMKSDMHHLAPLQGTVNSSRSDDPFGEVADEEALRWFGPEGGSTTAAPAIERRSAYAKRRTALFQPRSDKRGDLARRLLYFAAIYESTVSATAGAFDWFEGQKATLLQWHTQDPPDADEITRSGRIAAYQGNENPFILDPTLANRAFGSSLPVELMAFTATIRASGISMTWATASETNNAGFEIQQQHGDTWTALDFVSGAGTTIEAQHYSYTVTDLAPGLHRFRLKQVDYDGQFEFSPVVEVAVELPDAFLVSAAYPNPLVAGDASFSVTARQAQPVQVALFDVLGRQVAVLYAGQVEASQPVQVRVGGDLAPGLYLVRVQGQTFTHTQKLVVR